MKNTSYLSERRVKLRVALL